jgi:hypothetical protein
MKPQNSAERSKVFARFIIFYVISIAVLVVAVYFGIRVPLKQNKQLQAQLDVAQQESDFDRRFFNLMRETKRLLDTVNISGPQADMIEGRISQKIQEMDAMINKDSIQGKRIYSQVALLLNDAKNDKKMIRSGDKQKVVEDFEKSKSEMMALLNDNKSKYQSLLAIYQQCVSKLPK